MERLTPEKAREIALSIVPQIKGEDMRDFFVAHSTNVVRIAKILAKKLQINEDILEIAGRIHDIGYTKDIENHSIYAIPMLESMGYEVDDILKDCILHHGYKDIPETKEGKIFQLADKLSILEAETIEVIISHGKFPLKDNDLAFLKSMSERAISLLEKF